MPAGRIISFKILKIMRNFPRVMKSGISSPEICNGSRPERDNHSSMKAARRRNVVYVMCKVFGKYKSIFIIDDQSWSVPTTICLQSLRMDDRSIGAGKNLPKIVRWLLLFSQIQISLQWSPRESCEWKGCGHDLCSVELVSLHDFHPGNEIFEIIQVLALIARRTVGVWNAILQY